MNISQPKSEVWWDQENKVLRIVSRGKFTKEDAENQINQISSVLDKVNSKPANVITDLSEAEGASIEAQVIFSKLIKSPYLSHQAFVGMNKLTQALLSVVVQIAEHNKGTIRFFTTYQEGLDWLKSLP